jgi:hypothetical protein
MTAPINFQVKRIDGSGEFFSADRWSTIIEAIGRDLLENSQILLNGQIINKHMTLQHENVTEGSVLVIIKNPPPSRRRASRRLPLDCLYDEDFEEEERQALKEQERARISDLILSGWEMSRKHDRMCAAMRARYVPKSASQLQPEIVNLATATDISIEPLPTWFGSNKTE